MPCFCVLGAGVLAMMYFFTPKFPIQRLQKTAKCVFVVMHVVGASKSYKLLRLLSVTMIHFKSVYMFMKQLFKWCD